MKEILIDPSGWNIGAGISFSITVDGTQVTGKADP
jgi:hypothetical protein